MKEGKARGILQRRMSFVFPDLSWTKGPHGRGRRGISLGHLIASPRPFQGVLPSSRFRKGCSRWRIVPETSCSFVMVAGPRVIVQSRVLQRNSGGQLQLRLLDIKKRTPRSALVAWMSTPVRSMRRGGSSTTRDSVRFEGCRRGVFKFHRNIKGSAPRR